MYKSSGAVVFLHAVGVVLAKLLVHKVGLENGNKMITES